MGIKNKIAQLFGRESGHVIVMNTGPATAENGSMAVSGYSGPAPRGGARITVKDTGPATASGPGGKAVSGIDYT